jgi:hypothetical protein
MLAYVFWHKPRDGVDPAVYEAHLATFHAALGLRSRAERVRGAPWLTGDGYADWYFAEDWEALGDLNRLAVSGGAAGPHAAVAALMGWGAGSVMALVRGGTDFQSVWRWLVKPPGMPYEAFYASVPPQATLWRRQMVLGPVFEFAMAGASGDGAMEAARTEHALVCGQATA